MESLAESAFYRQGHSYTAWCRACHKTWSRTQAENGYFRARRQRLGRKPPKRLSPIERAAYAAWSNAGKRASRNGRPFTLTREWVTAAFQAFADTHFVRFNPRDPFRPSLDRIDNSRSYEPDNVRVTWLIDNVIRHCGSEDDVKKYCKLKLGLE